jgi:hypothetical protein
MRGSRAVKRLINKLGGYRPYYDVDTTDATETDESEILEEIESDKE